MTLYLEIIIYLLLIGCAIIALRVKDLLAAIVVLSAYSLCSAFLFAVVGAVDVGFTEAVVGAGLSGLLFLAALFYTSRKSAD
ncbi:MAG: DUF4040 domain-containing protein [Bacteroidota bacterium]|nr:DUF4040 domain-containing protein [Bacteroidota bacterium]